tara:strand:- start:104 stop:343 length:240 start_codon:yes stop_codon:yes gene_type:complete
MAKFCTECGSGINPTAKFCEECGVKLGKIIERDGPREVEVKNVVYTKPAPESRASKIFGLICILISIGILAIFVTGNAG